MFPHVTASRKWVKRKTPCCVLGPRVLAAGGARGSSPWRAWSGPPGTEYGCTRLWVLANVLSHFVSISGAGCESARLACAWGCRDGEMEMSALVTTLALDTCDSPELHRLERLTRVCRREHGVREGGHVEEVVDGVGIDVLANITPHHMHQPTSDNEGQTRSAGCSHQHQLKHLYWRLN